MQQTCLSIESTRYVVIVNEILACEYVTECNVAPPGVRKLNKQAVDFGYVVIVKLDSRFKATKWRHHLVNCVVMLYFIYCCSRSFYSVAKFHFLQY